MAQNFNGSDEAGKKVYELKLQERLSNNKVCPVNGKKGRPVQNQTVKALLKISLRSVHETQHFFCSDKDCPVVYYTADGNQTFGINELREAVYQKDPANLSIPICYCFQHTVGKIQAGSSHERQIIVEDIKQGIATGQCACDLRNPQGSCCLGNVNKLVKNLEA